MKFFVEMTERHPLDPQELAAMMIHRINSLKYQIELLKEGILFYAFRSKSGERAILMYETNSLEDLDWKIKRDPQFGYTEAVITPVISSKALVVEAEDFIGENILTEDEIEDLELPRKEILNDRKYWLAFKKVNAFSPLLPEEAQRDIDRRTIIAQRGHFEHLEFADHNPVGRPIGILVAEGELNSIENHVESCAVFPDTIVQYTELESLQNAIVTAKQILQKLNRPIPE